VNAKTILDQLAGKVVLIVGDVMIDRYLTGHVSRISPEAPVPVVLQQGKEDRLGGAANVALNIRALGSTPLLCSVIGEDADGARLKALFPASDLQGIGLVASPMRQTTVKTRILGNNQQMLRIDTEDTHDLQAQEASMLLERVVQLVDSHAVEAIIFQDYNKGVLTEYVIREILDVCRQKGILSTVDPKKRNFFAFEGVDLFKPNLKEIRDSAPFPVQADLEALDRANAFLQEKLKNRMSMITLSEKGLYLNVENKGQVYPTVQRKVADVSGAGDTVISIATLALVAGINPPLLAMLSNLAGGQVCEFPGVVPVERALLERELEESLTQIQDI
jgi:rfaE bifunctional protein kinase chain/domain